MDIRTVAGRLGHSGGGTTTLKVYSAWVAESDQRAAVSLFSRLPQRPAGHQVPAVAPAPYESIAAELRADVAAGVVPLGAVLPTNIALMERFDVSAGTAQRAVALMRRWGLADVARGRRAVVVARPEPDFAEPATPVVAEPTEPAVGASARLWEIVLRGPDGRRYPARHVTADLTQPDQLRRHLVAVARIEAPDAAGADDSWVGDFELEVLDPDNPASGPVRVLRWDSA